MSKSAPPSVLRHRQTLIENMQNSTYIYKLTLFSKRNVGAEGTPDISNHPHYKILKLISW